MMLERTSLPSATTAAAVSSHDVSIPKINTTRLQHIKICGISNRTSCISPGLALNPPLQICRPVACVLSGHPQLSATAGRLTDHLQAIRSGAGYAAIFAHPPDCPPLAVFPLRYLG